MAAEGTYPVRVDATLTPPLSRWLWLIKWALVIPHYIVLGVLWLAFALLSVVAFAAILITGRYPRPIFEFNAGVLRWTWRVQYYAIGAFGTDSYPPFSLADDPAYPARLEITYPATLSRGLALVKWWLLAIPHYLIVGVFTGTGAWFAWRAGAANAGWTEPGLIGLLALIAGGFLLVTGRYPEQIFDFVLGMNRWVLRVAAYAALMTDAYPPFRLDLGGHEPSSALTLTPPGTGPGPLPEPLASLPQPPPTPSRRQAPPARPPGWSTGRVISLSIGAVLALCSLGVLAGGGAAVWADTTQRSDGYIGLGTTSYTTPGRALASGTIRIHGGWAWLGPLIGQIRIHVTQPGPGSAVFAAIAPTSAANRYLSGAAYTTVTRYNGQAQALYHPGTAVPQPPARAHIWAAHATGSQAATLRWAVRDGDWTIVVMHTDASAALSVRANVAASFPGLPALAAQLLTGGVALALIALALIIVPVRLASGIKPPVTSGDG